MTLPMEMLWCRRDAAIIDVASSGNDVPRATTVSAMIRCGTENTTASLVAPSTRRRAPKKSAMLPITTIAMLNAVLLNGVAVND